MLYELLQLLNSFLDKMWLLILYFSVNIGILLSLDLTSKNEPAELTDLFIENLKADPVLKGDHEVSQRSKGFIDNKIEKFVHLVTESQNADFSRAKRSLRGKAIDEGKRHSINIVPIQIVPTQYSDDLRLFQQGNNWYAVSLEDKSALAIFQYSNGSFNNKILEQKIEYSTNVAVLASDALSSIVVGELGQIKVFQFNFKEHELELLQSIKIEAPKHIALWEQDHVAYLSITENLQNHSNIKIYQWLGRHFDHVQDIRLFNIKKTVPFNIHGSYFLAAVKYGKHNKDEIKSYSEIFKFNLHSMKFEPYQRLLTNGCTDIKYFASQLHGENYHFLVVVHNVTNTTSTLETNKAISVIYKYEDQYFIPFQSVKTNAVEWQPVQDLKGNGALIAVTSSGLKGFQYDGWHFFEDTVERNENDAIIRFEDIQALHTYDFLGERVLVIACAHCKNTTNIYSVNFTNFNAIKDLHSEVLAWCTGTLKQLKALDEPDLVSEALRGDLNEEISLIEDQKRQLSAALKQSSETLHSIEDAVAVNNNKTIIFEDSVEAETIIFNNNSTYVNALQTASINGIMNNFMDNVLDIDRGFIIDGGLMEFNTIIVENALNLETLNGVPLDQYIALNNNEAIEFKNLSVIDGSVTLEDELKVENSINHLVNVTSSNLLLKSGNQTFAQNLTVGALIVVDNLITNNLNTNDYSHEISHIKHLTVKDLNIGGYLNRVSVPVLARRALKMVGNQTLEEPLSFQSLNVHSLNVEGNLTGQQFPGDFPLINSGEYVVSQDVEFLTELKVNKLEVLDTLNNISVTDEGKLDILLGDSPQIQYISGNKTFSSLVITNPIKLRGKINNAQLQQRFNPIIIDSDTHHLQGDLTINGLVEVPKLAKCKNLKSLLANNTFNDVLTLGIKLTNTQIPTHLEFTQPLDLEDVVADKVNSLNPHEWMLESSNSSQIIRGEKRFLGDLYLEGHTSAFRINDVDLRALNQGVLKIEGDQEVEGVWEVDKVIAMKGLKSNKTYYTSHINGGNLSDVLTINGSLKVKNLNTTNLQVNKGLVNSGNVSEITINLVKKTAKHKIIGQKRFIKELQVENLVVDDDNNEFIQLLKDVMNDEVTLNTSLNLFNDIGVNHLKFAGKINNISKQNFDSLSTLKSSDDDDATVISSSDVVAYDEVIVLGDVFVADNFISGKNLTSIEKDTVKLDEDHEFGTVRFGEAVTVRKTLSLDGNIENLDLDTTIEQNSIETPVYMRDKVFMSPMDIKGTLYINNTVNGLDIRTLCTFSQPSEMLKTLKIEGNVVFAKGPKVLNINGLGVKNLKEGLWFVDKPTNISGTIHLQQNTTFNSSVHVTEFVDSTNLSLLSKNYLSKTKDQLVTSSIAFNEVTFSNISTPLLITQGPINGLLINDILKTVLIQGIPQIFESPPYFEEVKVSHVNKESEYTVNGFNLKTDVMRYNQQNVVTGPKIFRNLNVDYLNLTHNVKIQGVDVLDWLGNAILANGTFSVKGKKVFNSGTFEQGLSLRGKLNNQAFNEETIMLVNTTQAVTGKKSFRPNDKEESIRFKTLSTKGLANGIDLEELVQKQTNRHQNNTLSSNIIFDNNVVVKNINIDVLYGNVNVSALIANVTKLRTLERFQNKFKGLLDMGIEAEKALNDQATFFKYYKEIPSQLRNAYDVFGLNCEDGVFRLVAFYRENGTNVFRTFEWNTTAKAFIFSAAIIDHNESQHSKPINYIKQISVGNTDYLYIEYCLDDDYAAGPDGHSGHLLQLINPTTFKLVAEFRGNATVSVISFVTSGLNELCLGFVDNTLSGIKIYCSDGADDQHSYYWASSIPMGGIYKATTIQTQDSVFLFMARHGHNLKEPSIVVYQSAADLYDFVEIQTIYEGAGLNELAACSIGGIPYLALSFGTQESTVESGRISIRRLDTSSNQFLQWQHIPVTAPLGIYFVTETSFEPLLVVPSADAGAPLQTFRYDGVAGFKRILKGSSLSINLKVRILGKGHFLAVLQEGSAGRILGAVAKGTGRNY